MALPTSVLNGRVIWQAYRAVADGPDAGTDPDIYALADLTIVFTPSITYAGTTQEAEPSTVFLTTRTATTDANGNLVDENGEVGIDLIGTDQTSLSPTNWTYNVSISGDGATPISMPISVPVGQTVDLAIVAPVQTFKGTAVVAQKGDKGDQGPAGATIVSLTQASYDAITPDPDTIYVIVG